MLFIADVLQGLVDVDTQVFLSINGIHNPYFDFFMSAYSGKWIWVPMYAAILYVLLRNMSSQLVFEPYPLSIARVT